MIFLSAKVAETSLDLPVFIYIKANPIKISLEFYMLTNIKSRQTILAQSVRFILNVHDIHKLVCSGLILGLSFSSATYAETASTSTSNDADISNSTNSSASQSPQQDSLAVLEQQSQSQNIQVFKPIEFNDLENLPETQVDANMANEIYQVAESAKQQAANELNQTTKNSQNTVIRPNQQELNQINQAPVNVDNLMREIQSEQQINVQTNTNAATLRELNNTTAQKQNEKVSFFRRILNRIKPSSRLGGPEVEPKITAQVVGAPTELADNITAKLSSYTQEAFSDFNASLPQLRNLSNQAAQAVGYYNAKFTFEKLSDSRVRVTVVPNDPVKVASENIEFSGQGANTPQFGVIRLVPDLEVGDILNHGEYEQTKTRITEAASDNGYFDAYWRLHDVRVKLPENTADINLKYETGDRYKLGDVEFRMSDPSKKFPLNMKVLRSMVPWKDGDDYTFWRVNTLANNLTNSRYFNYTLVDTIKPDPIEKPLEIPADIQEQMNQQQIQVTQTAPAASTNQQEVVSQNVADESQFAGTQTSDNPQQNEQQSNGLDSENDQLQAKARAEKKTPVIVTLNADRLNNIETGIGYGTDTEFRIRTQYRRAIVNSYGHSFDANLELSKIRQSLDTRYSIPYNDPINDYINILSGYEREQLDDVGPNVSLETESAIIGAERVIKNPLGGWQNTFGVRYRLDRLSQEGDINSDDIPDAFKVPGSDKEQESLLLSYELSKATSNNSVNPTRGFKQSYKIDLGSDALLSDANMAILSSGWDFIYSLGENDNHQFVGRADLNYIFTNDFEKVPYNLRFFAGGDQTIRGFDYKSLSPEEYGYKVGGQALAVGSIEYNYQFKEGWRAAVFTDFGNAYDKNFDNGTAYSVGVGVRWRSPIGPIRLDIASGISDENHPIRLHFFIGSPL